MLPSEAEIAFAGTVESVHVPSLAKACGSWPGAFQRAMMPLLSDVVVELRVDSVWRGLEGDRAWVSFGSGCVATTAGVIGQQWLFLEHADPDTLAGKFEAGPCYFPGLLKDHGAIVASLGAPHSPKPRRVRSGAQALAWSLGLLGLALLAVLAGLRAQKIRREQARPE